MPPVVLKLFARQGPGPIDRRTKRRLYASSFEEHNNSVFSQSEYKYLYQTKDMKVFTILSKKIYTYFIQLFLKQTQEKDCNIW